MATATRRNTTRAGKTATSATITFDSEGRLRVPAALVKAIGLRDGDTAFAAFKTANNTMRIFATRPKTGWKVREYTVAQSGIRISNGFVNERFKTAARSPKFKAEYDSKTKNVVIKKV